MAFYKRELETMPREKLKERQLEQVKEVVHRVYNKTKFYRDIFDKAGVKPDDIKTLDDFRKRVPMITKADLVRDQQENPPYGSRLCVPENQIRRFFITAGTSGRGQEMHCLTQADIDLDAESNCCLCAAAGMEPGEISALIWPIGTMAGGQGCYAGLMRFGLIPIPIAPFDTKTRLGVMVQLKVHSFWATPAYLTRLARACEEMGIEPKRDFPRLKAVMLSTEPFPSSWALEMEKFWGAKLYDIWGSTQVASYFANNCEKGVVTPDGKPTVYHCLDYLAYVELINPETGEPANYGEWGDPVVTTFLEGVPMIRFSQGDRIRLMPPDACDCGRTGQCWETGTIARYDDMIKMKGINVWPDAVDNVLFSHKEIDEYNGLVYMDEKGAEQIKISFEFKKDVTDPELKKNVISHVTRELLDRIGLNMNVIEVPYGTVERFEYKARRWTDDRIKGLERVKFKEKG